MTDKLGHVTTGRGTDLAVLIGGVALLGTQLASVALPVWVADSWHLNTDWAALGGALLWATAVCIWIKVEEQRREDPMAMERVINFARFDAFYSSVMLLVGVLSALHSGN